MGKTPVRIWVAVISATAIISGAIITGVFQFLVPRDAPQPQVIQITNNNSSSSNNDISAIGSSDNAEQSTTNTPTKVPIIVEDGDTQPLTNAPPSPTATSTILPTATATPPPTATATLPPTETIAPSPTATNVPLPSSGPAKVCATQAFASGTFESSKPQFLRPEGYTSGWITSDPAQILLVDGTPQQIPMRFVLIVDNLPSLQLQGVSIGNVSGCWIRSDLTSSIPDEAAYQLARMIEDAPLAPAAIYRVSTNGFEKVSE